MSGCKQLGHDWEWRFYYRPGDRVVSINRDCRDCGEFEKETQRHDGAGRLIHFIAGDSAPYSTQEIRAIRQ